MCTRLGKLRSMPELAAIYAVGVLLGFIVTAANIALRKRRRQSSTFQRVESNLRKVDLYWSENEDRIVDWSETRAKDDAAKGNGGFMVAGALISGLSWPGVFFLLILVLSEHVLAKSRREKALFASPLAWHDDLEKDEVERHVADLTRAN